jgi:hypothetical protein
MKIKIIASHQTKWGKPTFFSGAFPAGAFPAVVGFFSAAFGGILVPRIEYGSN